MEHISAFQIIWSLLMKHNGLKCDNLPVKEALTHIDSLLYEASSVHQTASAGCEGSK